MESKTYLLFFSILLAYYSYLCDRCEEYKGSDCFENAGFDDKGIYCCTSNNYGENCYRVTVNVNISSCESAFDEIKDIFRVTFFIFDSGSCEKINNNC